MPNLKLYFDDTDSPQDSTRLQALLVPLRDLLCQSLNATPEACQIALVPVRGVPNQPAVNAELTILQHPDRTPERLRSVAAELRGAIDAAVGLHTAVRISIENPTSYVTLK